MFYFVLLNSYIYFSLSTYKALLPLCVLKIFWNAVTLLIFQHLYIVDMIKKKNSYTFLNIKLTFVSKWIAYN